MSSTDSLKAFRVTKRSHLRAHTVTEGPQTHSGSIELQESTDSEDQQIHWRPTESLKIHRFNEGLQTCWGPSDSLGALQIPTMKAYGLTEVP